jgi:hypothetical protein
MNQKSKIAAALALLISILPAAQAEQPPAPLPIRPQTLTTEQYNALVAIEQNPENVVIGDIRAGYRDENVQFATDALSVGFLTSLAGTLLTIIIIQAFSL